MSLYVKYGLIFSFPTRGSKNQNNSTGDLLWNLWGSSSVFKSSISFFLLIKSLVANKSYLFHNIGMEQITQPVDNKKKDDDFLLSGMLVTFGLLAVMGLLIYLFNIQAHAQKCEPKFDASGALTNNCPPPNPVANPSTTKPGQIQFLNNLGPQKIPALDGN